MNKEYLTVGGRRIVLNTDNKVLSIFKDRNGHPLSHGAKFVEVVYGLKIKGVVAGSSEGKLYATFNNNQGVSFWKSFKTENVILLD